MEDDLDALPSFEFPKSEHSSSFEMPDASILASQRKIEITQEHEIKKYKTDSDGCLSCSEGSDTEISSCLEVLQIEVPKISISIENPGLLLSDLNTLELHRPFTEKKAAFLLDLVEKFSTSGDNTLNALIQLFIASFENVLDVDTESYSSEDIHCQLIALSLIVLDRKCRRFFDIKDVLCILHKLNLIASSILNEHAIIQMAEHILKLVSHYHDRLYLAELFVTTNSENGYVNLTNLLPKLLSYASLCELIDYKNAKCLDMATLHSAVLNGQNWPSLSAYEQYIAVLLINMVMFLQTTSNCWSNGDESFIKQIISFLLNIKSNESNKDDGNFLKVKVLVSKLNLLWQNQCATFNGQ